MINIDFTGIELQNLITHLVGNKLRDEKFYLSINESLIDEDTKKLLLKHFLLPIRIEEFYSFSHSVKLEMNEIYKIVNELFSNNTSFIDSSQSIAKLLYEQSMHPKVKEGKLNIAYFTNIIFDGEIIDAIGIFKSEKDTPFIKMRKGQLNFNIEHEYGFEIKGIDKGCIILNTDSNKGYKLLIIDNINKSSDAQYWKDDFLGVQPVKDEYHQTNQFLGIAKEYVTKQLSDEFEVNKADQIDLLNRSVDYFKTNDKFEKEEFEKSVFQSEELIESFRNFDNSYRDDNEIELSDSFDISSQAVKKQARVFKKVLKLDKNFHIYIHGDKELIEQGVEKDGRKYYKIYYEDES